MTENQTELSLTSEQLSPVKVTERISVMDSLRGMALVGILMMNIEWFNRPVGKLGSFDPSLNGINYSASWFVRVFVEGKFYKLFALLFGMGFAVMLIRAQQSSRPFVGMFIRRMSALFVFGMLHYIFLWDGDILHDYAFAGLLLLAWVQITKTQRMSRFSQPKSFLRLGLYILIFPVVSMIVVGNIIGMSKDHNDRAQEWSERVEIIALSKNLLEQKKLERKNNPTPSRDEINFLDEEETKEDVDTDAMNREERVEYLANERAEDKFEDFVDVEKEKDAINNLSFWSSVEFRAALFPEALVDMIMFSLVMLLPIFMLGYWLIASGVLNESKKHPYLFRSLAWVGTIIGLAITTASLHIMQSPITKETIYIEAAALTSFGFAQYLVTAGYFGVVVCLYQSDRWQKIFQVFSPIGRMALTNYIMHTVILALIFYGYGAGMFGNISRAPQMLIVALIIISQLVISTLWLRYYRFGPLEWLWRCVTYKKIQPMKLS